MQKSASKLNINYLFASTEMEWGNLMFINGKDEQSGSVGLANYLNHYIYTSHTLMIIMYTLLLC